MLRSALQQCCHHNLVDRYKISISQMTMNLLLFTYTVSFSQSPTRLYRTWLHIRVTRRVYFLNKSRNCLSFSSIWVHFRLFDGVRVSHLFSSLCCVEFYCFVCTRPVPCVPNVLSVSVLSILDRPSVSWGKAWGEHRLVDIWLQGIPLIN
jgi:hypothetical protein